MTPEALNNFDSQESVINSQEKQQEAIRQETDRFYSILESSNYDLNQMHTLVDNLSTNPLFNQELVCFQDNNSIKAIEMFKNTSEEKENSFDYFGIDKAKIGEIQVELKTCGLDINNLLDGYKSYIENNLNGLSDIQKEKVKASINAKVLKLGELIVELKEDIDEGEDFKENRWIINEKIGLIVKSGWLRGLNFTM